jgi:hypothetical protein
MGIELLIALSIPGALAGRAVAGISGAFGFEFEAYDEALKVMVRYFS